MQYVTVKNLPEVVRNALKSVGYGSTDIGIRVSESVILSSSSGTGCRAFVTLVNLDAGEFQTHWGSWGGPNMFDRKNPVDNDHSSYPLPAHGAALTGHEGGGKPVYAILHLPASMVAKILPSAPVDLTRDEINALYCHKCVKGGQYRREELRKRRVPAETIDGLVARGLLKRNKAGSVAITTEGKNAYAPHYYS